MLKRCDELQILEGSILGESQKAEQWPLFSFPKKTDKQEEPYLSLLLSKS